MSSLHTRIRLLAVLPALALAAACADAPTSPAAPRPSLVTVGLTACDAQLLALESAINIAPSLSDKDRTALTGKVNEAQLKLAAGKPADAALKLADIDVKLTALEAAGKIRVEDAAAIRTALTAAQSCVAGQTPAA